MLRSRLTIANPNLLNLDTRPKSRFMPDIFISYSRKDSAQALTLAERLRASGMGVWIDQRGIEAATSWSGEIADAIRAAKAFVLLLSAASTESPNVKKELGVATEVGCSLVPVEIEKTELNRDFLYHLAGLQRVAITDFDGIVRALTKLGIIQNPLLFKEGAGGGEATEPPPNPRLGKAREKDERKSLMILPFEDLSPTADNQWFADGIVSEMISALSNVKALRLADNQATKEFRKYHGQLTTYAHEMQIRYFVQGDVRKFGDNIKISVRLLDIETGDHLWQDSMKGTMNDIFDIQEKVAEKVVEGLKIHLASDEKKKLAERGTENAEAYELVLKGREYFARQSKEGYQLAAQLWSEAIALDPAYANAYSNKANALADLYRSYTRDPALLEEGLTLINEARRLKPDLWGAYHPLSIILMLQGKHDEAEAAAQEYIRNAPEDFLSHFALGFFYMNIGQYAKAIAPFEEALKRKPEYLPALFNLVVECAGAKEEEKQKHWAEIAIPLYEKRMKLFPDEENNRVCHAVLLHFAVRDDEARAAARKLEDLRDGNALFNTGCLQCMLKDYSAGLQTFRKAIQAGFRSMRNIKSFLEDDGIGTLKGTPEWEEVREMVEKIEASDS
jgi:TolB-like protein